MLSNTIIRGETDSMYSNDKKRLDQAAGIRNNEATTWDKINRAISSRTPTHTSSITYGESYNSGHNVTNETGTINTAISLAASNLTSFLLPEKEDSIILRTVRESSQYQGFLDDLQKYITRLFFQSYTQIYPEMNAACYEAVAYGNGAIMVNFEQDSPVPKFSAVNSRNISILRDPYTNEINFMGSEYTTKEGDQDVQYMDIWEAQKQKNVRTITHRRWRQSVMVSSSKTSSWPISYGSLLREPGRMYGNGMLIGVLKEAQRLNALIKGNMEAIESQQKPIKLYNPSAFKNPAEVPRSKNGSWIEAHNLAIGAVQPMQTVIDITPSLKLEQDLTAAIREGLMLDAFLLPDPQYMTASEIVARLDQKIQILVPIVESLQYQLVHQLVLRLIERVLDMNILPGRPQELTLDILHLSIESRFNRIKSFVAQNAIMLFAQGIGQMAQLNPETIDNVNFDEMAYGLHRNSYLPASYLRGKNEIKKIREDRSRAMAQDKAMAYRAQTGQPAQ